MSGQDTTDSSNASTDNYARESKVPSPWQRVSAEPDKLMQEIIECIAGGHGLLNFTKRLGLTYSVVYNWLAAEPDRFRAYQSARQTGAHALFEEAAAILDEEPRLTPDGKVDQGYVTWQRNKADIRKWQASKLMPRLYGEKLEVESSVTHLDLRAAMERADMRVERLVGQRNQKLLERVDNDFLTVAPPPKE